VDKLLRSATKGRARAILLLRAEKFYPSTKKCHLARGKRLLSTKKQYRRVKKLHLSGENLPLSREMKLRRRANP
jgi:hypothetical protein